MHSHDILEHVLDSLKATTQLRRFSMLDVKSSITWSLSYSFGFQVSKSNTPALMSVEKSCQERCNSITLDFRHNILLHLWCSAFCLCWSNQATAQIFLLPMDDVSSKGLVQHVLRECSREKNLEMTTNSSLHSVCLLHMMRGENTSCLISSYAEK